METCFDWIIISIHHSYEDAAAGPSLIQETRLHKDGLSSDSDSIFDDSEDDPDFTLPDDGDIIQAVFDATRDNYLLDMVSSHLNNHTPMDDSNNSLNGSITETCSPVTDHQLFEPDKVLQPSPPKRKKNRKNSIASMHR